MGTGALGAQSPRRSDVLVSTTHTDEDIKEEDIVGVEMEPGDVEIHHPNIVYSSKPNTSVRRRAGLTIRYIPPPPPASSSPNKCSSWRGRRWPGSTSTGHGPSIGQGMTFLSLGQTVGMRRGGLRCGMSISFKGESAWPKN